MIGQFIILVVIMINISQTCGLRAFSSLSKKAALMRNYRLNDVTMSSSITQPVRVRFAPSPTGSLHVGGARTALFNWLLAKKTKGTFLIRVEDTDEARSTKESEASILADLKWMNMNWDEGPEIGGPCAPYRQSERKDIYKKYAEKLIAEGKAYKCFCTVEELDAKRAIAEAAGADPKYDNTWRDADPAEVQKRLDNNEPYTIRFKVPEGKVVSIDDIVRGHVQWDADASLGDFIMLRASGVPVYNFCVAVDDATMGITHVIRAEEHLTNTLRQMLVLEALGATPPTYAHCSLILGSDRSKLSKRHGATSVQQFSEQGFLPEAMMNYLANLGWNDGTPKEIYTPNELIEAFDTSRIIKSAAVFDMDKLKWINGQHIKTLPQDKLESLVIDALKMSDQPILPQEIPVVEAKTEPFLKLATKIAVRDMVLIAEARQFVGNCLNYAIEESLATDSHVLEVFTPEFEKIVSKLVEDYSSGKMPKGAEENFAGLWKTYMKDLGKDLGLKGKTLFHPVRLALTGSMSGPDIGDQLELLAYSEGVISSSYPVMSLGARIEYLKTFSMSSAVDKATKAMEAAAAAKATAAAEVDAKVDANV